MTVIPNPAHRNIPETGAPLAYRLGLIVAHSPLRYRLLELMKQYPSGAPRLEDWLLDVANARGATFFMREPPRDPSFSPPDAATLSNEELVCAICHLQNEDRPHLLRAAAQLISREAVEIEPLIRAARRERVEIVLAELARLALRVAPQHRLWRAIFDRLGRSPRPRSPLLHWSRLAVPTRCSPSLTPGDWKLIA